MVRLRGRIACRFGCMVGAWIHRYWFADRRDGCWSCKIAEEDTSKHQEMDAIAMITQAGLTALGAGNLEAVGIAMDACHEKLQNIGVSSPELDSLVEAVRPHSLGAKLTGAGGGGCMVALTQHPQRVAEAIEVAGGTPLISRLGADGVRNIVKNQVTKPNDSSLKVFFITTILYKEFISASPYEERRRTTNCRKRGRLHPSGGGTRPTRYCHPTELRV